MAHLKLNDADEQFLRIPQGAEMVFAGASGTQSWIERDRDCVVTLGVKSVGVALANAGSLEVAIEIGGDAARGRDGPAPADSQLRASQAVQVMVKAGQRLSFRAYPAADDAHVLRTVVWTQDLHREAARAPQPQRTGLNDQRAPTPVSH